MKTTKLDYINIFFAIILGLLIILNFATRFKNKEQDKMLWNAEIHSSAKDSLSGNLNSIKIIDAVFYNNFNHSESNLDSESKLITSAKSENFVYFKIWEKELLPDSLSLKYFSIDERQFYHLTVSLPYQKMKDLAKGKNDVPVLILEIQPKGKALLKIILQQKENSVSHFVQEFTAKKNTGDLDMLVYEKSLGQKYNRYESIENITDYSDLLQNQYKWAVKIEKDEKDVLKSVYAFSFKEDRIEILEDNDTIVARNIPKTFYISGKNKKEYYIQYNFSPIEILSAFRKLKKIDSSDSITFTFKVHRNEYIKCEISKNGIVIPLKDLYPEKP
ncbi:hypothetical protein [Flavobacterium branchiicola]|uniref:Uncharacterized protein n=1 Tax=Flavobacterium branchiicola TaxID=1114875 RepID=A0ABV9PK38_9FLAO|nr:hypothetical protein [Flavobacterium branchiicola]MBS7256307.1 hypothetical protein [Flavobacterium branchiicola]